MKSPHRSRRCLPWLSTLCLGLTLGLGAAVPTSAQWTEPDSYKDTTPDRRIVALRPQMNNTYKGVHYDLTGEDDSDAIQDAIDWVAGGPSGGEVIFRQGAYKFREVNLKSDVHIIFEGCTLIPYINDGHAGRPDTDLRVVDGDPVIDTQIPPVLKSHPGDGHQYTKEVSMFRLGRSAHVSNVSLRSRPGMRATFRMIGDRNDISYRVQPITCLDVDTFKISGFLFKNKEPNLNHMGNKFKKAAVGLSWRYMSTGGIPKNGLIQDLSSEHAHHGYGTIQAQAGEKIHFENLYSEGGVTLRLETDYREMTFEGEGGLRDITGHHIRVEDGQNAVKFAPHAIENGEIALTNVSAVASEYAVEFAPGSLHSFEDYKPHGLSEGHFAKVEINGISAQFGMGPINTHYEHLLHYPVEFHKDRNPSHPPIRKDDTRFPNFTGPSIAPVTVKFWPNAVANRDYEIFIDNVKLNVPNPPVDINLSNGDGGFDYHPDIIYPYHYYGGTNSNIQYENHVFAP